ncbi:MAG: diaminopimelate epimerase [candidate division WOR-3 bacterium]|nr:MAG: diaminopimelate epimerase [candidate division WOR-3 bacterium]
MKPIFFTKMEGTGNNFLIIDNRNGYLTVNVTDESIAEFVKKLADSQLGAGSDGVILLEQSAEFPFEMRYFNRDGSEAVACLNGARCVVSYAFRLGLLKDKGKVASASGPLGYYYRDEAVSIEVAPPVDVRLNFSFTIARKKYNANFLRVGVPHCVIFVDDFKKIDVKKVGEAIRKHKTFKPEGTNVDFVKIEKDSIFVRTYERGVEDETLSCGSGALASAYIATKLFMVQSPVGCKTKGGDMVATIKDKLYLEGPVKYVYDGVYYIE